MPETTVSQKIYSAFFTRLGELAEIKQETIAELQVLHKAGRLANKRRIARLVQNMERRHAEDQDVEC